MKNILIYGSYGYTGRLIVDQCIKKGFHPVLAGRNEVKLKAQAEAHDLEWMVFEISEKELLIDFLAKGDIIIHCGGPFIHTAKQVIEACIETKTHYLDITGEYEVFDLAQGYNVEAKKAGIMIMPGAGFDVVPSDCLAAMLKAELPEPTHLELAFVSKGGKLSRGTTKTMIENLGALQAYRLNGEYAFAKMGENTRLVDFGTFEQTCMAISWGDISTGFYSTGIPNIQVYAGTDPRQIAQVRKMNGIIWLLKIGVVKRFMLKQVDKRPDGPSEQKRNKASTNLWGKAWNDKESKEMRLQVPNGYNLTADASVTIAEKVLSGYVKDGYQTPSSAYGKNLILEMEGAKIIE